VLVAEDPDELRKKMLKPTIATATNAKIATRVFLGDFFLRCDLLKFSLCRQVFGWAMMFFGGIAYHFFLCK
jgi:hypothetical protein